MRTHADPGGRWLAFVKRVVLGTVVVAGVLALVVGALLGFSLYRHAHPARVVTTETPASLFLPYEDVSFPASDGVSLSGWWIPGKAGMPVLILAHDLGESRASLLGLAAKLAEEKYAILVFDLRGHGTSSGTSSFGVLEKRDLLGALDWIGSRPGVDAGRIGIVGVGMGAHAAILAASERPAIRCLALDSPFPDAPSEFLAASLPQGVLRRWLARGSGIVYDIAYRVRAGDESAAQQVRVISDRNLLFLAPKDVEQTSRNARELYDSVPETRNNFKNLLLLNATRTTSLYAADRDRYDQELTAFFRSYLAPVPKPAPPVTHAASS